MKKVLLSLILIILVFSAEIFAQQKLHAVVYLKNGNQVNGVLMKYSASMAQIAPGGDISFQNFYADQIDSMRIIETKQIIYFKTTIVTEKEKPAPVGDIVTTQKTSVERRWSLIAATGPAWIFYEATDMAGFNNSPLCNRFAIRYHPQKDSPLGGGEFIELALYHTNLVMVRVNVKSSLNVFALNYGLVRYMGNGQSYIDLLLGISIHSLNHGESMGLSNSYLGIRLGLGMVIPLAPRYNLTVNGSVDITYTGRKKDMFGQEHATSAGGLTFLNAGLMYDLPKGNIFTNLRSRNSRQTYFGGWGQKLGLTAGLNIASVLGKSDHDISSVKRIVLGIYTFHQYTSYFSLQPEIFYTFRGYKVKTTAENQSTYYNDYLSMAVLSKWIYPLEIVEQFRLKPAVLIGPTLSFNINADIESGSSLYENNDLKNVDVGILVGLCAEYGNSPVKVMFQYELGVTPLYKSSKLKNSVFTLLLTYEI